MLHRRTQSDDEDGGIISTTALEFQACETDDEGNGFRWQQSNDIDYVIDAMCSQKEQVRKWLTDHKGEEEYHYTRDGNPCLDFLIDCLPGNLCKPSFDIPHNCYQPGSVQLCNSLASSIHLRFSADVAREFVVCNSVAEMIDVCPTFRIPSHVFAGESLEQIASQMTKAYKHVTILEPGKVIVSLPSTVRTLVKLAWNSIQIDGQWERDEQGWYRYKNTHDTPYRHTVLDVTSNRRCVYLEWEDLSVWSEVMRNMFDRISPLRFDDENLSPAQQFRAFDMSCLLFDDVSLYDNVCDSY